MSTWPFHHESEGTVATSAAALFAHLDDPMHLSAHMSRRSWRMGGGRMDVSVDAGRGQAVGSHIVLSGSAFGLQVALDEVVTERAPPRRKVWQTFGEPHLLVIDAYRMGFDLAAGNVGTRLRVFIDYALPTQGLSRRLGRGLGHAYARWCTRRMVGDAIRRFGLAGAAA